MRFYVVTLFPDMIERFCGEGLLGKAQESGRVSVATLSPRELTRDKHRTVDDTPYGGGSGMVMQPGPLVEAIEEVERREVALGGSPPRRILLTPQGKPFVQADARRLAELPALSLVCGRYEGVDERARRRVDEEISLGDFVLMGGEVAALAIVEAVARLIPGVLGNPSSFVDESHAEGLLEYPQYTRPAEFRGEAVPEVLLSGNHAAIARWRRREALRRTFERRPDLLRDRALTDEERGWLAEWSKA